MTEDYQEKPQLVQLVNGELFPAELRNPEEVRFSGLDFERYLIISDLEEDLDLVGVATLPSRDAVRPQFHPQGLDSTYLDLAEYLGKAETNYHLFRSIVRQAEKEAERAGVPFFGVRVLAIPKEQEEQEQESELELVKGDDFVGEYLEKDYEINKALVSYDNTQEITVKEPEGDREFVLHPTANLYVPKRYQAIAIPTERVIERVVDRQTGQVLSRW